MRTSAFGKFHPGKGTCHANHHGYFKSAPLILMRHGFFFGGGGHCIVYKNGKKMMQPSLEKHVSIHLFKNMKTGMSPLHSSVLFMMKSLL